MFPGYNLDTPPLPPQKAMLWGFFFTVTPAGRKYSLWRMQILFKVYNKPVEKKGQETYEALSARAKLFEEKVNDRTQEISSPCVCHRDAARASRAS